MKKLISMAKKILHKRKMHKQFMQIQKWQDEMYKYKTEQELNQVH